MKVLRTLSMISINCLMNWRIEVMKKAFYIVGAGLAVGAVAATAMYLLSSKKTKESESRHDYKDPGEESARADNESLTEVTIIQEELADEDAKNFMLGSMYFRHKSAAAIMSDSVEKTRENIKVPESTNDEIDKVSDELDKMLIED